MKALALCSVAVRLAVGAASLWAQGGTTAGSLVDIPATPRALALQGAYASVVGDEGSIFVNPAGMAPIHHFALGLSYEKGLLGSQLSTGALAMRIGRFDVGFGVMYQDLGGDSVVVPDPATGGDFGQTTGALISAWNGLAVGALAYRRGMLSLGGSVKVLHEEIGGGPAAYRSSAVAGDIGFAIAVFDIMSVGGVLQNIGGATHPTSGTAANLPRTGRIGFTLNFIDPQGTARLMATTDWVKPPGSDSYWAFGFEGGVVADGIGVLGRLGVATGRAATDRKGLSLGAGLVVRSLHLDYAWQPFGALAGSQQRLGVRWIPP
ncbi:MAG: hypothetical protein ACHQU1_07725 [Gemmatimonadales bacterium]